jgi:hypothetical protein
VKGELEEYAAALELLNEVVTGNWDSRFNEIEVTALMEANRLLSTASTLRCRVRG